MYVFVCASVWYPYRPSQKNEPVEEGNFRRELCRLKKTLPSRYHSGIYGKSLRTHIPAEALIISLMRLLGSIGTFAGIAVPPRSSRG